VSGWSGSGSQLERAELDHLAALGVVSYRSWKNDVSEFAVLVLVACTLAWFMVVGVAAEARRAAAPAAPCGYVGEVVSQGCVPLPGPVR
jgi:hypothetical protein